MRKSKQLTVVECARITTLYEENYSLHLIAHRLKIPNSTFHDTITQTKRLVIIMIVGLTGLK